MFRKTLIASAVVLTMVGCSDVKTDAAAKKEPVKQEVVETAALPDANFLKNPSTLQYMTPDFTKLVEADFKPAFYAGMKEHLAEVDVIANNPEPATFENTLVELEKTGDLLNRTANLFYNLAGTDSNDERRALQTEMSPLLAEHQDNIYLNAKLFDRVKKIYDEREALGLAGEDLRLTEVTYKDFVSAGAKLNDAEKEQVRGLNKRLSELTNQFGQNLLKTAQDNAVVVDDVASLAGLSAGEIEAAKLAAEKAGHEGKYLLSLVNTTRQAALSKLENREVREKLWRASAFRATEAEVDNRVLLKELVELRAEKAKLFGFNNWAEYQLQGTMAKKPEAVMDLLGSMAPKVVANVNKEAADIEAMIKAEGGDFAVQPWDWFYYSEKVRQQKFNLDSAEVSKYFQFDRVLKDGVFYTMNRLFGITFKPRPDLPVYHPDVEAYEIFDKDGETSIGLFYADYFARKGKRGGAWMNTFVSQTKLLNKKPVVINVMNIPKAPEGQPQLVSYDNVTTIFHELGHGLHGAFSDVKYPSLAGTATSRDYVEFPSTFMEDWAAHPEIIANYAKHHETGEPIPAELLEKVRAAANFNQGFDTLEYLASALLDMAWHSVPAGKKIDDVEAFEQTALETAGVKLNAVPPRYKSPYFAHIFAGGYSAGYYAYMWSEILAADAFAYMRDNGGLSPELGEKFRREILATGNTQELMTLYKNFRGAEPTTEALLERRGINL